MLHWSSQRILHVWHGFVLGFAILLLTPSDQASPHVSAPLAEEPATKMSSLPPKFGMLFSFFERNIGQFDDSVKYVGRGPHHTILFRQHEVEMILQTSGMVKAAHPYRQAPLRVLARTGQTHPDALEIVGKEETRIRTNYFVGNQPDSWQTQVPTYTRIEYHNIYPGIDLAYYRNEGFLEYDFAVTAKGNPEDIQLTFEGAERIHVDANGNLVLESATESLRFTKPIVYQSVHGRRKPIAGEFVLTTPTSVGFRIEPYDHTIPLIIDPTLVYSTYFGGSGDDFAAGAVTDSSGNSYITGWTSSLNLPSNTGVVQVTNGGGVDAFVAKFTAAGALVYCTYLGGTLDETETPGLAIDTTGNLYVAGMTASSDFPTTPGAFQRVFGGGRDVFVTKLNPSGSALLYSTYIGGNDGEGAQSIAVDPSGSTSVTGFTLSRNFPVTPLSIQRQLKGTRDAFVTKVNPFGNGLVFSTYLGGTGTEFSPGIAVDRSGNVYVTGLTTSSDFPVTASATQTTLRGPSDAFMTKLNSTGSTLLYSTYLGGYGEDDGRSIAVEVDGTTYVSGFTDSFDFPVSSNAFQRLYGGGGDAFVTKFSPVGITIYSSYLGGVSLDFTKGLAIDPLGRMHVTGGTFSQNFPTTSNALYPSYQGGEDAFVIRIASDGTKLEFSSFLGGSNEDRGRAITVDLAGNIIVAGFTNSLNFPLFDASQSTYGGNGNSECLRSIGCDGFLVKIRLASPLGILLTSSSDRVSRGSSLPITMHFSNSSTFPTSIAFVLVLRSPIGQDIPLFAPYPITIAPNSTFSTQLLVPSPSDAPVGQWQILARLVKNAEKGIEVLDQSILAFNIYN